MNELLTAVNLTANTLSNPRSIDPAALEFAWQLTGPSGAIQTAYEIELADTTSFSTPLWSSGLTSSDDQFGIPYDGSGLAPAKDYFWRVRAADGSGRLGPWSETASFGTGLPARGDWTSEWIGHQADAGGQPIYLRGHVNLPEGLVRARAFASSLGWYRLFVNGEDLTGNALVPRFTPYDHEVEYQSYDITEYLRPGSNVLGLVIADGRYRGALGMNSHRQVYGDRLAGIVQVLIELADGTTVRAGTDGTWVGGPGQIASADPKFGETIDLRVADNSLATQSAPTSFSPVTVLPDASRRLVAERVPAVQEVQRLRAKILPGRGGQLVDFGQNFAGVVRIRVTGPAGRIVTLQHAEDIGTDGSLDWQHLDKSGAAAKNRPQRFQRDEIILDGNEHWVQPWFTIHGFRYLEVTGLEVPLTPADVEGLVLTTPAPSTGSFSASDSRLEQLYHNAQWSLYSNFTDTATDCPTRERGGFTGDAQIFAPAASILVDSQAFFRNYLHNLALEQFDDGSIPMIVPSEISIFSGGPNRQNRTLANSVGWGDASVILPWTLYERYGDKRVLAEQFESMQRWVDYLVAKARRGGPAKLRYWQLGQARRHILDRGFIWGEWIRPGESTGRGLFRDNTTNRGNIATAYFAHSSRLLAKAARVIGRTAQAEHYEHVADKALKAWQRAFIRPDGRIGSDRQDDYVRALAFDLVPNNLRTQTVDRLVRLIESAGDHLSTGFLSTPMLLGVLSNNARADVAYRLLLQSTSPSWLEQVEAGATTIRENWAEFDGKGTRAGSSNHYAFGSVVEWMVSGIVGISPIEPGYRRVRIAPMPGGNLHHAGATVPTPFGHVSASWARSGGSVNLIVDLPIGTTGIVTLPGGGSDLEIPAGRHEVGWPDSSSSSIGPASSSHARTSL